ncbi:hypothetical protein AVEN_106825-2-1, partial [Araneus ventricosus]
PSDRIETQDLPDILPPRTRPDVIPHVIRQRYWNWAICSGVIIVAIIMFAIWWFVNGHLFQSNAANYSSNPTTSDKHAEGGIHH